MKLKNIYVNKIDWYQGGLEIFFTDIREIHHWLLCNAARMRYPSGYADCAPH